MPELPEVQTIVNELRPDLVGLEILRVEERQRNAIIVTDKLQVIDLVGLVIKKVERRGKFIVISLDKNFVVVIHLRMTGRLMWSEASARKKYTRTVLILNKGKRLFFSDVRKFGKVWICRKDSCEKNTGMGRLGLEPLEMSVDDFIKLFYGKRGILKNNLLRQDLVAGIGNIYADESCFLAGLHPCSRIENLTKNDLKKLFTAIKKSLREGIKHCGVSVSDFVGTKGDFGRHQHYLNVYGRQGDKCKMCGNLIRKIRAAGRGTYFCPICQKVI